MTALLEHIDFLVICVDDQHWLVGLVDSKLTDSYYSCNCTACLVGGNNMVACHAVWPKSRYTEYITLYVISSLPYLIFLS